MPKLIIEGTAREIADTVFMLGITPDNMEIETGIEIEEDGCHCGYSGCECGRKESNTEIRIRNDIADMLMKALAKLP